MNAFHKQLQNDVDAVWFNPDEFGELHDVDGRQMRAIVDSQEILRQKRGSGHVEGIYTDNIFLFVRIKEYGAKPRVGVSLLLDKRRRYRVANVREENGVYAMELEAVR